jgi:hypothetical protein
MKFTYNSMWLQQTSYRLHKFFPTKAKSIYCWVFSAVTCAHRLRDEIICRQVKCAVGSLVNTTEKWSNYVYEVSRDEQRLTISRFLILGTIIYTGSGRGIARSICEIAEGWSWNCFQVVRSLYKRRSDCLKKSPWFLKSSAWVGFQIQIRILPSSSKNSKKNLDIYCFVTSLWLFIFEEWCNVPSKCNKQKTSKKFFFYAALKITDEKSMIRSRI